MNCKRRPSGVDFSRGTLPCPRPGSPRPRTPPAARRRGARNRRAAVRNYSHATRGARVGEHEGADVAPSEKEGAASRQGPRAWHASPARARRQHQRPARRCCAHGRDSMHLRRPRSTSAQLAARMPPSGGAQLCTWRDAVAAWHTFQSLNHGPTTTLQTIIIDPKP